MMHIKNHNRKLIGLLKPFFKDFTAVADHDYKNVFMKSKADIDQLLAKPLGQASILIIGCGYRYSDVILYSGVAREAVGIDIARNFYRDGFLRLYQSYRYEGSGLLRSFYLTLLKRIGLKKYYDRLAQHTQQRANHAAVKLYSYDGQQLPFEDNYFDCVMSNAVLEHVQDLNTFFSEVARVSKVESLSYHLYHNYYSFSGGHKSADQCNKNPWGHLRGIYTTRPWHLNEISLERVLVFFNQYFNQINTYQCDHEHSKKGIDAAYKPEAEELLTPEIRKELGAYSDEQLLTRSYLMYGRKLAKK